MLAFSVVLFVLLFVFYFTSTSEGFDPMNKAPSHKVTIPAPVPTKSAIGSNNEVEPYTLPGQLPVAPYQQIAATSPLPYQDTQLIKANRQQIISLLDLLKGFLSFEAQEISEKSDPSIQLPLTTARSDFHSLQSELEVINRNPGIQPTITLSHLNEIASNVAYLQQQVRLIGAAGTLQGPVYEFTEGFVGAPTRNPDLGKNAPMNAPKNAPMNAPMNTPNMPNAPNAPMNAPKNASNAPNMPKNAPMNAPTNPMNAPMSAPNAPNPKNAPHTDPIATLADLKAFISRIQGEKLRLSASGTSDPSIVARVKALTQMQSDVQQIVDQVDKGLISHIEIPINKNDIDKAFPILGKPSEPLPQIIKSLRLPAGLANILPSNVQKDPNTTKEISRLLDKYGDQIINGVSASFEVKYISPNERAIKTASTVDRSGFPSMSDLNNISNFKFIPRTNGALITDPLAPRPMDAGRGPSHFDWKQRAKEIEDQVKKRGLKQSDYGILEKDAKVSNDFSWKGYVRMICTRLQATMDPSLPETCGCPPMDWKGWRIAK